MVLTEGMKKHGSTRSMWDDVYGELTRQHPKSVARNEDEASPSSADALDFQYERATAVRR